MTEGMRHGLLAGDPDSTEAEKIQFYSGTWFGLSTAKICEHLKI